MPNREAQVRKILTKDFSDLFDQTILATLPIKTNGRQQLWVPRPLSIKELGVPLRDGVGHIRIEETFDRSGRVTSYIYKFSSNEYLFTTTRVEPLENNCEPFDFHYDKEEGDKPHEPHLNVVHPSLRYISRHIELEEFLGFIRNHFFESSQGKLVRKTGHLWANRM